MESSRRICLRYDAGNCQSFVGRGFSGVRGVDSSVCSISIVSGINKFLGAVMGAAEASLLAFFSYKVLTHFGIYVL